MEQNGNAGIMLKVEFDWEFNENKLTLNYKQYDKRKKLPSMPKSSFKPSVIVECVLILPNDRTWRRKIGLECSDMRPY